MLSMYPSWNADYYTQHHAEESIGCLSHLKVKDQGRIVTQNFVEVHLVVKIISV